MADQWFLPAEMARRLGVSSKALRVYERAGLVTPVRTQAGWRAYGPDQIARLHQVLALKGLGLSLKRISDLLAGRLASLDAVLKIQQQALEAQATETRQALALIKSARAKLAANGVLSPDDLTQLTRETVMNDKLKTNEDWKAAFDPIIQKHFDAAEVAAMGAQKISVLEAAGYDESSFGVAWEGLIQEARALMAIGDLDSIRAKALVLRWNEMTIHFTKRDPEITRKVQAVWNEASANPDIAPRLPITPDMFAFVQKVADGMRARGELPPKVI